MPLPTYKEKIVDLVDSNGEFVVIQEGEGFNVTGTFKAHDGSTLIASQLGSVTMDLYDEESGSILNSRSGVNILPNVAANGTLTQRFAAADAVISNSSLPERSLESHIIRFTWVWNDGVESRTGLSEYRFRCQKLKVVA